MEVIVFCGSLSQMDLMTRIKDVIQQVDSNHIVVIPDPGKSRIEAYSEYIKRIIGADAVVIIPKESHSPGHIDLMENLILNDVLSEYGIRIGEATTYELALAVAFNKHIGIIHPPKIGEPMREWVDKVVDFSLELTKQERGIVRWKRSD